MEVENDYGGDLFDDGDHEVGDGDNNGGICGDNGDSRPAMHMSNMARKYKMPMMMPMGVVM